MYERRDDFVLGGNNGYQQNGYQTNNLGFRPEKRASDGVAIASFVIGIISIVGFCCLGGFLGIVGAILGIIALKDNQCNKRALAAIGLSLSALAFILTLGAIIYGGGTDKSKDKNKLEVQTEAVGSESNTQNNNLENDTEATKPTENTTESTKSTENTTESTKPTENNTEASKPVENTKESLIYNNKDVKVYFLGVEETYLGTELKFRAENNRNEDIEVSIDTLSINGYDVSTWFYLTAGSGLKAVDSVTIFYSSLKDIGVDKIDSVTCKFRITAGILKDIDTFSVTLH